MYDDDLGTCAACTQEVVRTSVVLQLRHALLLLGRGVSAWEVLSEVPSYPGALIHRSPHVIHCSIRTLKPNLIVNRSWYAIE